MLSTQTSAEKQAGIEAYANEDFGQAASAFEAALRNQPNDPESLIYLNNARIGNEKAYSIAVVVPANSSPNPAQEILRGVAQAQNEVNRSQGINGVPLKVVIADDNNDPDTAKQVASQLVRDDAILGVIGHFGSEATLAAAPVYQQAEVPLISPTSTSTEISELGNYIFRTVPSDRFTAAALSRELVNTLGLQNAVVFFNGESSYSTSLKDEFTTAIYGEGGQIVGEYNVSDGGFDPNAAVEQAIAQGANALVLLTNTSTLDQALQVIKANQNRLALLGGDSLYNPQLLERGGADAQGMIVAVPWHVLSDAGSRFVQSAQQLWRGDINWRTAMAYDAAEALLSGIEANPTRTGVERTLSKPDFQIEGGTGTVRFLPSGDRNQAMQLVQIEPGQRSGYGYDFIPAQP